MSWCIINTRARWNGPPWLSGHVAPGEVSTTRNNLHSTIYRIIFPLTHTNTPYHVADRTHLVFLFLFYFLHPFTPNAPLVPGLPSRLQHPLRQALFFATSVVAGCSLIHVTNTYGYLATMKQAPPLGCLWLWAVVELDLVWGCVSLLVAAGFLRLGGYDLK